MPVVRPTRTKIVATLGPASWDEPMLSQLITAGVDVARINCSHTNAEGIRKQVARVRRAAAVLQKLVTLSAVASGEGGSNEGKA